VWALGLALATATVAATGESVSVRVTPTVAVAPTMLAITVNVARQPENRELEIVVDSGGFYRMSRVPLDGEHAPLVNTLKIPSVPAGEYEVIATVISTNGRRPMTARAHVEVMPGAGR
jgi:hypothetical protein